MAKNLENGVCDNCGNLGLPGEKCVNCGGVFVDVSAGIDDAVVHQDDDDLPRKPEEPEVYPLDLVEKEGDILDDDDGLAMGK